MNEQNVGSAVVSDSAVAVSDAIAGRTEDPPGTEFSPDAGSDAEPPSSQAPQARPSQSPLSQLRLAASLSASEPKNPRKTRREIIRETSLEALPTTTHGRRHPHWKDVPDHLWEDWRWQRQHAVRSATQLAELISLPPEEVKALEALESKYRTAIPPYYFSLIDVDNPDDPIRIQSVPTSKEDSNISGVEFDDPLEEDRDSPVPGVTHRYPDRALLITTPVCSMYCRFCTRKRVTMDRDGWDAPSHNELRMIEYVRNTEAIRDVIVSGGDPLTLPVAKLRWFVTELAAIDHVDVIRIGTRVPVTLPQRLFDNELVDLLASAGKIWIQTHFNHPVEITPETARACRNLINAGMPVNNHSVLMKGVNDSVPIMRELIRGLLRIKVRPYYLFHCDPVTGAGHFRTSIWKGMEIIEGLRGHVSGLGIPTYVVDGLHGAGKIPVMPNYILSASDDAVVLRNYEGMIFRYAPEDKQAPAKPIVSDGVSGVLSGEAKPLMPETSPRMARRRKFAAEKAAAATPLAAAVVPLISINGTNGNGSNGIGKNGNGHSNGKANGNGKTNGKSDGHAATMAIGNAAEQNGQNGSPTNVEVNQIANDHSGNRHSANGKRSTKPQVHLDVPALKDNLLRRPARSPAGAGNGRKTLSRSTKKE
jgi:lysine 2,3-aminomutase